MRYKEFRIDEDELFEIKMSPSSLKKLAADVDATVGIEFEMIVPPIDVPNLGVAGNMQKAAVSFENAVGTGVIVGGVSDTEYTVVSDGSLRPKQGDQGMEFRSPPMSVEEILSDFKKVVDWAKSVGAYTGKEYKTGLHMNVSIPGINKDKLDYVKLALLLGDKYILEKFKRLTVGNGETNYAKSSLGIIVDAVKTDPLKAKNGIDRMRDSMTVAASKSLYSGNNEKYTSINAKVGDQYKQKDKRVEFRAPGGDYINDYISDPGKFTDTLLRFAVALDAACDPEKYKKEYQTKLYKLLMTGMPEGSKDTVKHFVQYVAGGSTRDELKKFIKAAQTDRVLAKVANETKQKHIYTVKLKGTAGETKVQAVGPMDAIKNAIATNPSWKARATELSNIPADMWEVKDLGVAPMPTHQSSNNIYRNQSRQQLNTEQDGLETLINAIIDLSTHAETQDIANNFSDNFDARDRSVPIDQIIRAFASSAKETIFQINSNHRYMGYDSEEEAHEAVRHLRSFINQINGVTADASQQRTPQVDVTSGQAPNYQIEDEDENVIHKYYAHNSTEAEEYYNQWVNDNGESGQYYGYTQIPNYEVYHAYSGETIERFHADDEADALRSLAYYRRQADEGWNLSVRPIGATTTQQTSAPQQSNDTRLPEWEIYGANRDVSPRSIRARDLNDAMIRARDEIDRARANGESWAEDIDGINWGVASTEDRNYYSYRAWQDNADDNDEDDGEEEQSTPEQIQRTANYLRAIPSMDTADLERELGHIERYDPSYNIDPNQIDNVINTIRGELIRRNSPNAENYELINGDFSNERGGALHFFHASSPQDAQRQLQTFIRQGIGGSVQNLMVRPISDWEDYQYALRGGV